MDPRRRGPRLAARRCRHLGAVLVAAVAFGPTALRPHDLTGLALANPAVGAVLAVTWLHIFVPTARMIVRSPVGYLYRLPGDPRAARAVALAALILLHLATAALASAAALAIAGSSAWLPATALGIARGQARVLLASEPSPTAPIRIGIGAITVAAAAVICLATLGALDAVALIAIAAAAALVRCL